MPSRPSTLANPSPRRRFRFFQFSIRTLLLSTAAVAVFCNWYFQPQHKDEVLAGGELRLQRQVKVELIDGPQVNIKSLPLGVTPPPPPPKIPVYINHGSWSLRDKDDNLLVRGEFADGVPTGWWTFWHANGRKAAEGRMKQGAKCGLWRTWYEDGMSQTEVTFSDIAPELATATSKSSPKRRKNWPLEMSAFPREGIAKGWYRSGQLKFIVNYHDDQQQSPWQVFDPSGKAVNARPNP